MGHHHHHHDLNLSGKKLVFTILLNLIITAAEVIGGLISGSLALLSDALHNFTDSMSIILSYGAFKYSKKKPTEYRTFGYKRIQILAAMLNSSVLVIISFFLFKEAVHRFIEPSEIKSGLMMVVASIGLAANLISVFLLKDDSHKNINIKSAYLHLLADTISSVAVIAGGIVMYYFDNYWLDPLLTILIGLYILKEGYGVLKHSFEILMQHSPKNINLNKIQEWIENQNEISNIHHVHVWSLDDHHIYFEAHIDTQKDIKLSESEIIADRIEAYLKEEFNFTHITLQFEFNKCSSSSLLADCS